MPPSLNGASRLSEALAPFSPGQRALAVGLLLVTALALWATLAGALFLQLAGEAPLEASPLTLLRYAYHYGRDETVRTGLLVAGGLAGALLLIPTLALLAPRERKLFGDARFATRAEIKRAGLFAEKGIIVGKLGRKFLIFGGQQHVLVAAPTRSGKGQGIAIPNLLNWDDSVVALDIKRELWDQTAGYRAKHGQAVYLFNPAARDYRTHRYNPLFYVSEDPNFRVNDLQKIAHMLIPDPPKSDPFWASNARWLFLGIALYVFETEGEARTLGNILRHLLKPEGAQVFFQERIVARRDEGKPLSAACVESLMAFATLSDKTRDGVRDQLKTKLEPLINPITDAAMSGNDFDLRDLRKKRMSIYVVLSPEDKERLAPIVALFFQQIVDLTMRERPEENPALRFQILMLLDEFASVGPVPAVAHGVAYLAGYNVRLLSIIQSPSQLRAIYGPEIAQNFIANHALRAVFSTKDARDCEEISQMLGIQTVIGRSRSKARGLFGKNFSETASDQKRPLLLPQEIATMGSRQSLLITDISRPIKAKKIMARAEGVFSVRLLVRGAMPVPQATSQRQDDLAPELRIP